jgi:hypothetical protein
MNYYIIPKNNFNIRLNIQLTTNKIEPLISNSLIVYMNDIYKQLIKLRDNYIDNDDVYMTLDYINKIVNPFEFIHSTVPGSTISVSKVKPNSNIFFELLELFQMFNINDMLSSKHKMNIAHLTPNYTSTNYLLNMIREETEDNIFSEDFNYDLLYDLFIKQQYNNKLDLIICEFYNSDYTNPKTYIDNMFLILQIIVKYQMNHGMCVIKLDNIVYKSIIDIIFIISSFYDKLYLIKPSISSITKGDRYLICKGFNENWINVNNLLVQFEEQMVSNISKHNKVTDSYICSVLDNELPYYFLNKLDESNLVIGQQQLEAYDQIIQIFKNKNREEKIEHLKRSHIHKCVQWCEKNQLPHNKFVDKVNIFLNPRKKQEEE